FNQMVNFKDFTSPSSKFKYLIIESNERHAMLSVPALLHHYTNIASGLPSLAHRIVREEIRWGETVVFKGEYYWEWL
ncbi:hypothetical protein HAX54_032005, partial [Datura stramonium]|nr:hypothetical protein [Datura stramonium]